jgi:hypothetical protein
MVSQTGRTRRTPAIPLVALDILNRRITFARGMRADA